MASLAPVKPRATVSRAASRVDRCGVECNTSAVRRSASGPQSCGANAISRVVDPGAKIERTWLLGLKLTTALCFVRLSAGWSLVVGTWFAATVDVVRRAMLVARITTVANDLTGPARKWTLQPHPCPLEAGMAPIVHAKGGIYEE